MTMPFERTRALRWAGEFLNELSGVDLPEHIKRQIPYILRYYPSASCIENEAKFQSLTAAHSEKNQWHEPWLRPEEPK